MSQNYRRGRAYEYRTMRILEDAGFVASRTAGSHGCYDVIATNLHQVRLIQVKVGDRSAGAAEREKFRLLPTPQNVSKELWHFSGKRGAKPLIAVL